MSQSKSSNILLITCVHEAWGNAHLLRSLNIAKHLSQLPNLKLDIVNLFLGRLELEVEKYFKTKSFLNPMVTTNPPSLNKETLPNSLISFNRLEDFSVFFKEKDYRLIIVERRELPVEVINFLKTKNVPIVMFDVRGYSRYSPYRNTLESIDYVINAIPSLEDNWANLNGIEYLTSQYQKQKFSKTKRFGNKKNLFYLGSMGEDQDYLIKNIKKIKNLLGEKEKITILLGPNCSTKVISFIQSIQGKYGLELAKFEKDLSKVLSQVKVLFTHFGMLAFEAISAGIPTFFTAPSKYHLALVEKHFADYNLANLTSLEFKKEFKKLIEKKSSLSNGFKGFNGQLGVKQDQVLKVLTSMVDYTPPNSCTLCGHKKIGVHHRREWMNLYFCYNCLAYFMEQFGFHKIFKIPNVDYSSEYFIEEYKQSYGRSYLEDEKILKSFAKERIKMIEKWVEKKSQPFLLDIGCAYGFFLDVAKEHGYKTMGLDISSHVGKMVSSKHQFEKTDFLKFKTTTTFDVITLWYTIEHFTDIKRVLQKISSLQKKDGILAFSTPNALGISARFDKKNFLRNSPNDHYYIFSLLSVKKILNQYGYRFLGFRSTGIHFSRFQKFFPRLSRWVPVKLYNLMASKMNGGDTMEVYFKKII